MLQRWLLLIAVCATCVKVSLPFGIGKKEGLYSAEDRGIINLETGNFSSQVVAGKTAFLVEFYSSYCGHCINFAPHFKEFANLVADWNYVIKVGAVDCAQDVNMPVCRDYEIMGYPSIKYFPVNAHKNDLGELRQSHSKEVKDIISDMLDYLQNLSGNASVASFVKDWPKLEPLSISDTKELWSTHPDDTQYSILIFDEDNDSLDGKLLIMDTGSKITDMPIVIRRVLAASETGKSLMTQLGLLSKHYFPLVVAVDKKSTNNVEILWEGGIAPRFELARTVNDFIWKNTKKLAGTGPEKPKKKDMVSKPTLSNKSIEPIPQVVSQESEIKRRRYTTYMSDLENALLYALTHEVAQRAVISDKALTALHDFVEVLVDYFPARPSTLKFLQQVRLFVRDHEDMIRGEDLQDKLTELRLETGAFSDLGKEWVACRGSKPMYGGYPCSLWTLWHTLTVAQHAKATAGEKIEPKDVLRAMVKYVDVFFGCRECARHFLIEADDGKAIESEVNDTRMGVLWLWRTHNKANKRLRGDLSDDPAFPKEIFPNKQHCTKCYDTRIMGSDLWSEFNHDRVFDLLQNLFGVNYINMDGLSGRPVNSHPKAGDSHDIIILENSDKSNYSKKENQTWGLAFSPMDLSLCFGVYLLSAIIMGAVCLKFVAKKKFSHVITSVCGRRGSNNAHPLAGKV